VTWQQHAACSDADVELFYPGKGGSTWAAKRICAGCPVRAACLQAALETDERFGIWGGKSVRERRRLRPARAPVARRRVA
jgi:WhiB family transcriptional regulator, redox-sensing transcriptional regulator